MSNKENNKNAHTEENEDIKMGLTKKQRSWVYTGIFFTVVLILFVVNNTNGDTDQGPYPPNYQESQAELLKLTDLRGKIVILDFWATWCPPCRKGIPDLVELKEEYKDKDLEIVGISLDAITRGGATANNVLPFMDEYKINYPIVKGNENSVYSFGNINSIPTSFVLDREGKVIAKFQGFVPKETLVGKINSILNNTYDSEKAATAPDFSLPIISASK